MHLLGRNRKVAVPRISSLVVSAHKLFKPMWHHNVYQKIIHAYQDSRAQPLKMRTCLIDLCYKLEEEVLPLLFRLSTRVYPAGFGCPGEGLWGCEKSSCGMHRHPKEETWAKLTVRGAQDQTNSACAKSSDFFPCLLPLVYLCIRMHNNLLELEEGKNRLLCLVLKIDLRRLSRPYLIRLVQVTRCSLSSNDSFGRVLFHLLSKVGISPYQLSLPFQPPPFPPA